ncbi:MlaC/ttg2D family ABC transporter substrate-binding protein [Terricaulis sp.]|uniref:MlaC/ttg2D family ABC transporter substrate-binding protein n=1 Tax=Terricaulis sp. TaxID=2768686 RepID=UPI002AC533C2|nr:ABC transporter substrate-binding protein [Terricaulis sp.]MDZ4689754.1 ABC transporter substrate-binding protein [Terricaulis sp.]
MTAKLTRAAFFAGMLGVGVLAIAPEAHAARNADAERYVQENASAALRTLGDRSISSAQRRQTFDRLMTQFADMPRIANFVLGRYGTQLRADAALRTDWNNTFREYSIAVYEDRLDSYSGASIRVTDSVERIAGRDVIVSSEIVPRGGGRALPVQWRMLRAANGWKVIDVSLMLEGNQIWLAQQQQSEFLAVLGRNNGDIRALMANLRQLTTSMRQRIMARNA